MEKMGLPRFFPSHNSVVRSVSFNPCDRYLFCSGGNDGNICLFHAGRAELLTIHSVISVGLNRFVSAVRFNSDGKKILAITTSRRLSVIDTEVGTPILCYENCAFINGRDRTALATDPKCPFIAVCSYVNGKGITIFDLRMPLPLDFIFDFHPDVIRDITFLHESWPFHKSSQSTLLTLSSQGTAKINTISGDDLHSFDFNHTANSIVSTPERYGSAQSDGFVSSLVTGGTVISSYTPPDNCLQYNSGLSSDEARGNPNSNHHTNSDSQSYGNSNLVEINHNNNNHSNSGGNLHNRNNSSSNNNSVTSNVFHAYAPLRRNDILLTGNIESIRITRTIRQIVASTQHHYYTSSSSSPTTNSSFSSIYNNYPNSPSNVAERSTTSYDHHHSPNSQIYFHDRWYNSNSDQPQQIWRLKYSSNGAFLYAAGEGGAVRYYRRYPNSVLKQLGEVFRHRGDILDMDISPYDEYIVTASKDKTVGLICLGSPNHGWTEYYELT